MSNPNLTSSHITKSLKSSNPTFVLEILKIALHFLDYLHSANCLLAPVLTLLMLLWPTKLKLQLTGLAAFTMPKNGKQADFAMWTILLFAYWNYSEFILESYMSTSMFTMAMV